MSDFNQLDILILIALALGFINGFFKGFISQLIGLVGFFVAIWLSFKFYQIIEIYVDAYNIVADSLTSIVALIITFALAFFTIKLASSITQKTVEAIGLGIINRFGGAALGLIISLLLSASVLYYADPILELGFKETKDESQILPILNESSHIIKNSIFETKDNLRNVSNDSIK
ncbi:CvpA family protein [Empedobacter falsenii]|uniref:CvpA family protein n=1 Tax=Empedobacter TaxID=59734 RepID=UPI001CE16501|nr:MULTISPECIES: CvpA family protein [Empedobacter]MCA4777698.1 CvpA family protein [Empedobacter stercoris]MDM1542561.1 CvpA family protein [Empedobacter sp. 189-2]